MHTDGKFGFGHGTKTGFVVQVSGHVKSIETVDIYENDIFSVSDTGILRKRNSKFSQ